MCTRCTHRVQQLRQVWAAHAQCHAAVRWVALEKGCLSPVGVRDGHTLIDVFLAPIHDAHESPGQLCGSSSTAWFRPAQRYKRCRVGLRLRNLTGMTRFCSTSTASVPASIRSSFVSTPIVRTPCMESMRRNATSATCVCARVCRGTSSGSHLFVHLSGQLQRLADAQPCQWNNGACTT